MAAAAGADEDPEAIEDTAAGTEATAAEEDPEATEGTAAGAALTNTFMSAKSATKPYSSDVADKLP